MSHVPEIIESETASSSDLVTSNPTPVAGVASVPPAMPPMGHPAPTAPPTIPVALDFRFDGGAGTYLGVAILSVLLTVCTLGFALPWAVAMRYRWVSQHTLINGQRVEFTGSGGSLFGHWIKWWLLSIVTLGIYLFWVQPRLTRWIVEHQRAVLPVALPPIVVTGAQQASAGGTI